LISKCRKRGSHKNVHVEKQKRGVGESHNENQTGYGTYPSRTKKGRGKRQDPEKRKIKGRGDERELLRI